MIPRTCKNCRHLKIKYPDSFSDICWQCRDASKYEISKELQLVERYTAIGKRVVDKFGLDIKDDEIEDKIAELLKL